MSDPFISISNFPTAKPHGPAIGDLEHIRWSDFTGRLRQRREGQKDGHGFVPCTFRLEDDGRVRRIDRNLAFRTVVVLDIEGHKKTGEIPPEPGQVADRCRALGWTAALYTSHNHQPGSDIRYRVVLPLDTYVDPDLPVPEITAGRLGLAGVLDTSKAGGASLFYYPSCFPGCLARHETIIVPGAVLDAVEIEDAAEALRQQRDAIAAQAHADAEARRAARLAAGFGTDDSLIEKLRSRFDLADVLQAHGYDQDGDNWRHPNSSSGCYGANIKTFGGIDRVFSHNATDPLHADNLPEWCGGVKALDVFDVVAILDFHSDRKKALRDLASRFGLAKTTERRDLAGLIFRLIRQQAPQATIEAAAFAEGERLGLDRAEVIDVARWVVSQREAA